MVSEALLSSTDLMLRGATAMLLLLVAALLVRDHARVPAARLGALFAAGGAASIVCLAHGETMAGWQLPFLALAAGNNLVFWLFARCLFDDGFELRAWHVALWLFVVCVCLVYAFRLEPAHLAHAELIRDALYIESIVFAGLGAAQVVSTWRTDLVERRRRLRLFVIIAAAGYTMVTALVGIFAEGPNLTGLHVAQLSGLLCIGLVVAWSLLHVSDDEALFASAKQFAKQPAAAAAEAETSIQALPAPARKLVAALDHAMRVECAYRQEGLTIGALAQMQNMPEYKLRRLINQGLGFRNFTSFLNHYRLADAKAALVDPAQAAVPILTIALDAGFSSLGPFNRAFKAATGRTPSEFRRQALKQGDLVEISEPITNSASRSPKPA